MRPFGAATPNGRLVSGSVVVPKEGRVRDFLPVSIRSIFFDEWGRPLRATQIQQQKIFKGRGQSWCIRARNFQCGRVIRHDPLAYSHCGKGERALASRRVLAHDAPTAN